MVNLKECLDVIRSSSSHADEGSLFVLIHFFHGERKLSAGRWMQRLEASGWFKILHVSVFTADKELLDYFGVEKYPMLLLLNGNVRSEPFQPTQRALYFDLVESQIKAEAMRLLQQKDGSMSTSTGFEDGEAESEKTGGAGAAPAGEQEKGVDPYYHDVANVGVLNRYPGAMELERPFGNGCIRVMYFSFTEDESFEFLMLARQRRRYSFACFFHVVHSSAGLGFQVDEQHVNTLQLVEELERERRRSYEGEQDVLFEKFRVRNSNALMLYHPVMRAHGTLKTFSELRSYLDRYAHEEKELLREANLATVTDGKFMVLLGVGAQPDVESAGGGDSGMVPAGIFEGRIFDEFSDLCTKVAQGGQVACFWMRADMPLGGSGRSTGAASSTPSPKDGADGAGSSKQTWEQYLQDTFGWQARVRNRACPTILLFDGPSRFVSVFEDMRSPDQTRTRCYEGRESAAAGREWWLRFRGRKSVVEQGFAVPPRIPAPRYNIFAGPKPFLETLIKDWIKVPLQKAQRSFAALTDKETLRDFFDFEKSGRFVIGMIVLLTCVLALLAKNVFLDLIRDELGLSYSGDPEEVHLAFTVSLERKSTDDKWGIQVRKQNYRAESDGLSGCFSVGSISDDSLSYRWNVAQTRVNSPYRVQLFDVIKEVNGMSKTGAILSEMESALKIDMVIVRRSSQFYYDFDGWRHSLLTGEKAKPEKPESPPGTTPKRRSLPSPSGPSRGSRLSDSEASSRQSSGTGSVSPNPDRPSTVPMVANPCCPVETVQTLTRKRWDQLKLRPSPDGRFREVCEDMEGYFKCRDRIVKVVVVPGSPQKEASTPGGRDSTASGKSASTTGGHSTDSSVRHRGANNPDTKNAAGQTGADGDAGRNSDANSNVKVTSLRWMSLIGKAQKDLPIKVSREAAKENWGTQVQRKILNPVAMFY